MTVSRVLACLIALCLGTLCVSHAVAQQPPAYDAARLRKEFGFDPLKREPLVVLYRMDFNRDGMLHRDEIPAQADGYVGQVMDEAGLPWNGPIDLYQLAYAHQIVAPPTKSVPSGSTVYRSGSGSSSQNNASQSASTFLHLYDKNGNLVLERNEWKSIAGDWSDADTNGDTRISLDELKARFVAYEAGVTPKQIDGNRGSSATVVVGKSRLSDGTELPEWIRQRDVNGDGQVMMHEFARSWTQSLADEFCRFDLDNDGIITVAEYLQVDPGEDAVESKPPPSRQESSQRRPSRRRR